VENIATLLVRREEEAALKELTDATVRERINERRMVDYNSKEGVLYQGQLCPIIASARREERRNKNKQGLMKEKAS